MNGRKAAVIAGAAVGVCAVGGIGWLLGGRSGTAPADPAGGGAVASGPVVSSGSYQVAYGSGASGSTSTGVGIGYGEDCGSAVAAATAYAVAGVEPLAVPDGWDRGSYAAMLGELSAGLSTSASEQSTAHLLDVMDAAPAAAVAVPDAVLYPTDSLFRVRSCQAGVSASLDLALVTGATASGTAIGGLMPVSVDVVWHGGDWRLSSLNPFNEWEQWSAMTVAAGAGWVPPLGADGRARVQAAGGAGWEEFTNAGS